MLPVSPVGGWFGSFDPMKTFIKHQAETGIEFFNGEIQITQENGDNDPSIVYIASENVDRFCAMVKQCAEEAKKSEAK